MESRLITNENIINPLPYNVFFSILYGEDRSSWRIPIFHVLPKYDAYKYVLEKLVCKNQSFLLLLLLLPLKIWSCCSLQSIRFDQWKGMSSKNELRALLVYILRYRHRCRSLSLWSSNGYQHARIYPIWGLDKTTEHKESWWGFWLLLFSSSREQ